MQIQGSFEKFRVICQILLIVLIVLLAEFFRQNTIYSEKCCVRYMYRRQAAHGKTVARKRDATLNA